MKVFYDLTKLTIYYNSPAKTSLMGGIKYQAPIEIQIDVIFILTISPQHFKASKGPGILQFELVHRVSSTER